MVHFDGALRMVHFDGTSCQNVKYGTFWWCTSCQNVKYGTFWWCTSCHDVKYGTFWWCTSCHNVKMVHLMVHFLLYCQVCYIFTIDSSCSRLLHNLSQCQLYAFLSQCQVWHILLIHLSKCQEWYILMAQYLSQHQIIELRYEISNNMVCATSKGSDQPAHTRSLTRAFAGRLNILWVLSYWLNIIWSFSA